MHCWVNSVIEGELERSAYAADDVAAGGLENLLRLHRLAGRQVIPTAHHDGQPAYEVRYGDGHVHAVHWLSRRNEGADRPN